jgi:hypothetical protein
VSDTEPRDAFLSCTHVLEGRAEFSTYALIERRGSVVGCQLCDACRTAAIEALLLPPIHASERKGVP